MIAKSQEHGAEGGNVSDLIEFLRARLDEDEADALAVRPDQDYADSAHQERWSLARVLPEVAAKRAILARYERAARIPASVSGFVRGQDAGYLEACRDAVADLATVYSDHPDYRQEWKP